MLDKILYIPYQDLYFILFEPVSSIYADDVIL